MKIQDAARSAIRRISCVCRIIRQDTPAEIISILQRDLIWENSVIRYVCCNCGYVENWVENRHELDKIKKTFG